MPLCFVICFQKAGLKEYYSINDGGQIVSCNLDSDGYRLPSEAEWQYACKAGTTGYIYGELKKIAWYNENSNGQIQDIGKKSRMHGVCMICWGTFGNGVMICMMKRCMEHTGFFEVVVGLKKLEVVARLVVAVVINILYR